MMKLVFILLHVVCVCSWVAAQNSSNRWQTLNGREPLVIAKGGFSGLFPDSSLLAYTQAVKTSLPNVHLWCDVLLTKDNAGICFPNIRLENASNIIRIYPNKSRTHIVNGVPLKGYFSVDFTIKELESVKLTRGIHSRPPNFDGQINQILTVESMVSQVKPPGLWLNIPHDTFFRQHNLSMRSYIVSVSRHQLIKYISSPELGFLKSMASQFRKCSTKLVFQFLGPDDVEPTTNKTYRSLIENLSLIKTFAKGILIPKDFIHKVEGQYIQNTTSIVHDAHSMGIEVFAYKFANDDIFPYDFNYDPVAEYLSYIDNGNFSVDGVLSDFPITASEAIDCFTHVRENDTKKVDFLIFSSEGASGVYPGCTDMAYHKAVSDGVDILDCPIQVSSEGIPFCLGTTNLLESTNAPSRFAYGINTTDYLTYNYKWSEIQSLTPVMSYPFSEKFGLLRNPRDQHMGHLMNLYDFLNLAKNASTVRGVLISIQNAAYLAEKQGISVVDVVLNFLYVLKESKKKVYIMSNDSAVLSRLGINNYERVYLVEEIVSDIMNSTISTIRKFAESVVVDKNSILPVRNYFLTPEKTNLVQKLQSMNLSVYTRLFQNEFISQPWDFFSDASVELNTYISSTGINGIITDYPATSARYRRNRCLGYKKVPVYMSSVKPGDLLRVMTKEDMPPAQAPRLVLTVSNVTEPPLPPVLREAPFLTPSRNGQPTLMARTINSTVFVLVIMFLIL